MLLDELVLSESIIDIDGNLEGLSLGSLVAWYAYLGHLMVVGIALF